MKKTKKYISRKPTKKGATHIVNPPKSPQNFYPPEMTNHDKMIWRADQREAKLKANAQQQ